MSTEEPGKPGLVATPIGALTEVGGVELGSGMFLKLGPDDFYYGEDWTDHSGIMLEITRVGQVLPGDDFVLIEGYQQVDSETRARAIAVRIKSLQDSLIEVPEVSAP